jgi:hypothetical protein
MSKTGKNKMRVMLRRNEAVKMRIGGKSYQQIAEALVADPNIFTPPSYEKRSVYFDVQNYLNELRSTVQDNLIDVIDLENTRLDGFLQALWPKIEAGDTRAIETALHIMERRAKLLGLDSAIKVDWRVELRGFERAGALSEEDLRRELGDEMYASYRQFSDELKDSQDFGAFQTVRDDFLKARGLHSQGYTGDTDENDGDDE